jgi:DNA helicase-2/ATP-dependent DNA helicase PcrA
MDPQGVVLEGLDEQQHAAVTSGPNIPLVIFAGPGSGKTAVLIRRVAFAIRKGEDPAGILCLTFSRNAAEELRSRLCALCGQAAAATVSVCTFHGFCMRLLRRHLPSFASMGYGTGFHICSREIQREVVRGCLELWLASPEGAEDTELALPGANMGSAVSLLIRQVERRKLMPCGASPGGCARNDVASKRLDYVLPQYAHALQVANSVDYADLLLLAIRLLSESQEVLAEYQRKFSAMFVE